MKKLKPDFFSKFNQSQLKFKDCFTFFQRQKSENISLNLGDFSIKSLGIFTPLILASASHYATAESLRPHNTGVEKELTNQFTEPVFSEPIFSEPSSKEPDPEQAIQDLSLKCGAQGIIGGKIQRYVLDAEVEFTSGKLKFYRLPKISLFESSLSNPSENLPVFVDIEARTWQRLGCDGEHCLSQSFYHPKVGSRMLFNIDSDAVSLYIRAYDESMEKVVFVSGSCSF